MAQTTGTGLDYLDIRAQADNDYGEGLARLSVLKADALRNQSGLTPVEFYCVVELDPTEEKTAGGIILTKVTQDADKLATQEGTLVAVSPHAFTYAEEWPAGTVPQVGQRVMFKRYEGFIHDRKVNGVERSWRLLTDKSIVAIVEKEQA